MAINEPNQPRVPSTNRPANSAANNRSSAPSNNPANNNSAATTYTPRSIAPSNNPANNSATTAYTPRSSAPSNTSTSKRRKGSIISDTLNASRNASRYRKVLRCNESQASVHGPRGSVSGI